MDEHAAGHNVLVRNDRRVKRPAYEVKFYKSVDSAALRDGNAIAIQTGEDQL